MARPVLRPALIPDTTMSGGGPKAPRRAASVHNPGRAGHGPGRRVTARHLHPLHVDMRVGVEHAQRGAAPTRIGGRCRDHDLVVGRGQAPHESVESLGVDAVVVGHEQAHRANVASHDGQLVAGTPRARDTRMTSHTPASAIVASRPTQRGGHWNMSRVGRSQPSYRRERALDTTCSTGGEYGPPITSPSPTRSDAHNSNDGSSAQSIARWFTHHLRKRHLVAR